MLSFLRATLGHQGFRLLEAVTGREGLRLASSNAPDIVILDLGLPDIDGMEVIEGIRSWARVPIIILSARGREADKVAALERGADDYLTKPFGVGELIARIRVALRHASQPETEGAAEGVFETGSLRIDFEKRAVHVDGREVHLTPIEYRLLAALVKHPGKVLTHTHLLREVWGNANVGQSHYVRIYMASLRRKIEEDPSKPRYILTETGVGYRFREPDLRS
jgi:two-component system, OmpR family, KDP operon response regulator KdpE